MKPHHNACSKRIDVRSKKLAIPSHIIIMKVKNVYCSKRKDNTT
jgi:hypothetical protein